MSPPRRISFRNYAHPGNLPGHEWAGPVKLHRDGGRPMMTWKDAPFELTAARGTVERTWQRMQAHKDRIHVMKAHHADMRAREREQERVVAEARRMLDAAKARHANARRLMREQEHRVADAREVLAEAQSRRTAMHAELAKLEKEIDKVGDHLARNKRKFRGT